MGDYGRPYENYEEELNWSYINSHKKLLLKAIPIPHWIVHILMFVGILTHFLYSIESVFTKDNITNHLRNMQCNYVDLR